MWVKLLKNVANASANAIEANRPASASRATGGGERTLGLALCGPAKRIFSYKLEFRLGPKLDRQFDYGAAKKDRNERATRRETVTNVVAIAQRRERERQKNNTQNKQNKTRMRALGTKRDDMEWHETDETILNRTNGP